MYAGAAAAVDLIHALAMGLWVLGIPLLFVRSHPRVRRLYAVYAIAFVVLSQLSMLLLDECFLTALVRPLWERAGSGDVHEWFTVRASRLIFGMAPSHRAISILSEVLIVITALGVLVSMHRRSPTPRRVTLAR